MAIRDLSGKRYGYLLAISPTDKRIQRKVVWKCLCDCGNTCEVMSTNLTSGRTKSCGCKQYEIVAQHYREKCPQHGDVINGTEVIDYYYKKDYRGFNECHLLCECKYCGTYFVVKGTLLQRGDTKSCGCIKRSEGEAKVELLLKENGIKYEKEKIFSDCYFSNPCNKCRFDFFVDNKYLIEFDGIQHTPNYSSKNSWFNSETLLKIQKRDIYKNNWSKEHGIPLIRIPHYKLNTLCIDDLLLESTKFLI